MNYVKQFRRIYEKVILVAAVYFSGNVADSDTAWTKLLATNLYKVQFTTDGKNVAVSSDGCIFFLDILTGNIVKKFQGSIYSYVDFAFSDNGKIMVSASGTGGGEKSCIAIWDTEKLDTIRTLYGLYLFKIFLLNDSILIGYGVKNLGDTTSIYKININTCLKYSQSVGQYLV
jgi:WD40 repeat protein